MNDNKKKVLTDEELQEVSGGVNLGLVFKNSQAEVTCTKQSDEESCKKFFFCKWEDSKCVMKRF